MAREKRKRQSYVSVIPFVLLTFAYFILLRYSTSEGAQLFKGFLDLNFYNYSLSVASLLIPESILTKINLTYSFILAYILFLILLFIKFPPRYNQIKSLGLIITFLFLIPVLIVEDFALATVDHSINLLRSPSHRIYFASIGISILLGCVLVWLYEMQKGGAFAKYAALGILATVLGFNIYHVWQREKIWEINSKDIQSCLYSLKSGKSSFPNGSIVVVVNFPLSRGFLEPIFKVYYDLKEITVLNMKFIPDELPENPALVGDYYAPFFKGNILLVMGKEKMYDLSNRFNDLLITANHQFSSLDANSKMRYRREYRDKAAEINRIIMKILE